MTSPGAESLRLDKYLWFARLTKTRAAAQLLCAEGRMRLGGRLVDRAHLAVRVGDVLTFALHGRVRVIRILALPARRGPAAEAALCYVEIGDAVDGREPPT
ncbi:RNA-binding S4 domain-containing protein [Sphingomonas changnyeongensis]|uniref:RNA-binding S4 domain-containing protein n=1 Tax=Sphingomonas changnyeongensis TaxID=2698679 RepID=A0A7Z2NUJ4_9SPHN|nr:RNA-binding S4 domain-containing protein [Sphingomonas changnyeongensis]QHL90083.1 RNA-binding S4 domain-containing protein [Sphingomonas changnyeongensis]